VEEEDLPQDENPATATRSKALIINALFVFILISFLVCCKGSQNLVEKNVRKCNKVEKYLLFLQNI
jgi:hypothetical protein